MTDINENIKANMISEGSKEENISEGDIIIHTMPKKFLTASQPNSKAKGIGILILAGGGAVLIFGGIFLYFYVFNSGLLFTGKNQAESNITNNQESVNEIAENQVATEKTNEEAAAKENEIASSSTDQTEAPIASEPATSTVAETGERATTTFNIDNQAATSAPASLITPIDSDGDGFFDIEENLIGTDVNKRDSDSDNYEDRVEVLKLYNPTGNGGIIVDDYIKKYTNDRYGYYLYYPAVWQISNVGGEDSIVFNTGDNQFIQVLIQANQGGKTLSDWYLANTNLNVIDNNQILYKKGWEGIRSTDGLTVYLTKPGLSSIIIMTYSLGAGNVINFKNIFDMMINSLELKI